MLKEAFEWRNLRDKFDIRRPTAGAINPDLNTSLSSFLPPRAATSIASNNTWRGRQFTFWIASVLKIRNVNVEGWNGENKVAHATLWSRQDRGADAVKVRIKGVEIKCRRFGQERPSDGEYRVVAILGSANLRPGSYDLTFVSNCFTFAPIQDSFCIFAGAAALSVDGSTVWKRTYFVENWSGAHSFEDGHRIVIA